MKTVGSNVVGSRELWHCLFPTLDSARSGRSASDESSAYLVQLFRFPARRARWARPAGKNFGGLETHPPRLYTDYGTMMWGNGHEADDA
jgi:hypothetical protein